MRISVILPVYNGQPFLAGALDSILAQTCGDFECLIINDGSTDESPAIAERYAARDGRVRVIHIANCGLAEAPNHGLALARGKYIARMDADDISTPDRLSRQAAFLDSHPDIAICGTFAQTFGQGPPQLMKHPTDPDFIFASLIFRCPLIHPTVMMRGDMHLRYDPSFQHCEDYDLWARTAPRYRIANIPEPLLQYRVHARQISSQYQGVQRRAADRVWMFLLNRLGLKPSDGQLATHRALAFNQLESTEEFLMAADEWLRTLLAANVRSGIFPERAFGMTLGLRWLAVCDAAQKLLRVSTAFKASPLFDCLDLTTRKISWL